MYPRGRTAAHSERRENDGRRAWTRGPRGFRVDHRPPGYRWGHAREFRANHARRCATIASMASACSLISPGQGEAGRDFWGPSGCRPPRAARPPLRHGHGPWCRYQMVEVGDGGLPGAPRSGDRGSMGKAAFVTHAGARRRDLVHQGLVHGGEIVEYIGDRPDRNPDADSGDESRSHLLGGGEAHSAVQGDPRYPYRWKRPCDRVVITLRTRRMNLGDFA